MRACRPFDTQSFSPNRNPTPRRQPSEFRCLVDWALGYLTSSPRFPVHSRTRPPNHSRSSPARHKLSSSPLAGPGPLAGKRGKKEKAPPGHPSQREKSRGRPAKQQGRKGQQRGAAAAGGVSRRKGETHVDKARCMLERPGQESPLGGVEFPVAEALDDGVGHPGRDPKVLVRQREVAHELGSCPRPRARRMFVRACVRVCEREREKAGSAGRVSDRSIIRARRGFNAGS